MARTHVLPNCYEPLRCISLQNIYLRYYTKEWLNWSKAFVYCVSKPKKIEVYLIKSSDCTIYQFTGLITYLGCWESTQKLCKSLASVLRNSRVFSQRPKWVLQRKGCSQLRVQRLLRFLISCFPNFPHASRCSKTTTTSIIGYDILR